MKLDALSISDYVVRERDSDVATGSVHSVFRTSLNIGFNGFLLHIGSADSPLSCLGLTVEPEGASHLSRLMGPGDLATFRNGALRLYGRADVVEIDLSAAEVRDTAVPTPCPELLEGLDILVSRCVSDCDLPARIGLPWDARASRSLVDLARFSAVSRAMWEGGTLASPKRAEAARRGMCSAVGYLLGRGLGLTPSGDDVLMGFGTGLRCVHGDRAACQTERFFEEVTRLVPGKTTAVSEAYLQAMCDGHANGDYISLVGALESRDRSAIASATSRVLSVGHTSGADSLLGFAAAFCCLV